MEEHFRKLENMYHRASCNAYYQPVLKVDKGEAEVSIVVKEQFFHAAGAVHGSVYFKALDDAAFFSANSLVENHFVLTSNFTIHLLRPVSSGTMLAVGRVVHTSRNQFVAESVLYNSNDKVIARGIGSFVRSSIELTHEMGYV